MTKYSIAYANLNDPQNWQDFPEHALPSYVHLPENPNPAQQKSYQRRRLAYFLLWQLGKTYPDFANLMAKIEKDELGRPQIRSNFFDFNISHSGEWVIVILAKSPIGMKPLVAIDMESVTHKRNYIALLKHFANPMELAWFQQQKHQETAFYELWCIREAVLKATGIGLRKLSDIQYSPQNQCLTTDYCPVGKLVFCSELPFYLAVFIGMVSATEVNLLCYHLTTSQKTFQRLNRTKLILVN
ncbi:4'-phosphopantetheinyl transferase family protein [Actinobacillus delphinicola]|uniref:4'-phosphopantetheinyl transferase n=1 Tax=Actinobacillus delphinicola TaxID=51161 RepID=A0A448TSJ6_9PAST|nr:4'-phosphopantetheinyl transferase superfamily protein [Actinobacillus delphinicola]VEJ08875.1 4'-phosphopantetheinyl transferase [Actinobacillus delphinicola]